MSAPMVTIRENFSITPFGKTASIVSTHAVASRDWHRFYILVSYKTPVAVYDLDADTFAWTVSHDPKIATQTTKGHIRDFGRFVRPGNESRLTQAELYDLLAEVTGQRELA